MSVAILEGKRVLLGVTGSVASYKAVFLASQFTQAGALVDIMLTDSAQRFLSPLSFRSVTGRETYSDLWDLENHVQHIRLGESADMFLIAPITANSIAKLAHGIADNLLTLTALTARCSLIIAPAMDGGMYEHVATQENLRILSDRGIKIAGPAEGRMASGLSGKGRMLEPDELLGHVRLALSEGGPLSGRHIVVTAGPTQEPLDPVRYLTNRSSGRQGVALAQAALDFGARVTLISGPIHLSPPFGARYVAVRTAEEMSQAVLSTVVDADALLMAAAVADFKPAKVADKKIKKAQLSVDKMSISLTRNSDILMKVQDLKHSMTDSKTESRFGPLVTLGFAAETHEVLEQGSKKLQKKGLDFIAINDVSAADAGFAVETNRVILLKKDGQKIEMPLQDKAAISEQIIHHIAEALLDN
jgi:phosphopantothenoylcysteine decarboxylase/phosphopantothenate--cysteine ligase